MMRFKYLFLGFMLLILAGSMTAIAAADDYESLGDYTFDIPDGYQVTDKTDEMVTMQVDEDHPIIVYKLDSVADVDSFISLLETTGCKLVSEDAFQAGSFNVTPYGFLSSSNIFILVLAYSSAYSSISFFLSSNSFVMISVICPSISCVTSNCSL